LDKPILRTLIIDDSEDDVLLTIRELQQKTNYKVEFQRVDVAEELHAACVDKTWDIILSDYTMPNLTGIEALAIVRKHLTDTPFIFVSGTIGEDLAIAAMKAGANDYILKDNLKRLVPAIEHELHNAEVKKDFKKMEGQLQYLKTHDELTGLANRNTLEIILKHKIELAQLDHATIRLLLLDISRFSLVKDAYGSKISDFLLQKIATILVNMVDKHDTIARTKTDEFAIVTSHYDENHMQNGIINKINEAFSQPFIVDEHTITLACSIGMSFFPTHAKDNIMLINQAEAALADAKKNSENRISIFRNEITFSSNKKISMENAIRQAIKNNEFIPYYQPKVDLKTNTVTSAEVLIRWHIDDKIIMPSEFIPIAEETNLICTIGEYMLDKLSAQFTKWSKLELFSKEFCLAINASPIQFNSVSFVDTIQSALVKNKMLPQNLEIEITEGSIMQNIHKSVLSINRLKAIGCKLSIDDFGIGYSSLNYLKHFNIDKIKIDQSFIKDLLVDPSNQHIVLAIISLANHLQLRVTAEGVETKNQVDFLNKHKCDEVQGYYFSPPKPADEFVQYVTAYS
jgi:diguanylate cyclase